MTCILDFDSAALRRPAASIREDKWTTTLLVQNNVAGTYFVDRLVPQQTAFLRFHDVCKAERAKGLPMSNRNPALQVAAALRPFSDHQSLSRRITDYRTRGRDSVVASMVTCSVEKPTCQRERSLGSATALLKTSLHVS
jgi:hypothetical protein